MSSKDLQIRNTSELELGVSDHMVVHHASIQLKIKRPPPRVIRGRSFKRFNEESFRNDLANAPWSVCSIFDDPDDSCYINYKILG